MAIQPQLISINLAGGLETKTDPKQVAPPNTLVAENVDYVENRNLSKRNGAVYVPGGTVRGTAQSILGVGGTLIISGTGGLSTLTAGKWQDQANYNGGYDNDVKSFSSLFIGSDPDTDAVGATAGYTLYQRPAAVKFADAGTWRLIAVESRHVKRGTGLPLVYRDEGAVIRFYLVDLTTGRIHSQAVHSQLNCRDVVVRSLGTDFYVAYMTRTTSEVIKITGPTGSTFTWPTTPFAYTVCTGSHIATYTQDFTAFCDMQVIGGSLYHAVTVEGGSKVVVSRLLGSTFFGLASNVNWAGGAATAVCLAGWADTGTVNHIFVGSFNSLGAFKHTVSSNTATTPFVLNLNSANRYLAAPFDLIYLPGSTTLFMSDGQLVVNAAYSPSTGGISVIPAPVLYNVLVDGSAVLDYPTDVQQDTFASNAALYPGGLYAQLRSRLFVGTDGHVRAWVCHTDGNAQSVDFLLRLDYTSTGVVTVEPDAAMLYDSVSIVEVFRNFNTHTRGLNYILHGHPGDASPTEFYEILNTNIADNVYSLSKATYGPATTTKRSLVRIPGGALQTGSVPAYFDGQQFYSPGRFNSPVFDLTAFNSASGNLDPTVIAASNNLAQPQGGQFLYTYFSVTTWYDGNGRQMYGPVSPAYTKMVTTPNDAVQFSASVARYLPGTQIFRNSYQFPSVYSRVRFTGSTANADEGNDDTTSQLYSPPDGGELSNDPLPPLAYALSSVDRVYGIPSESKSSLVWTKPFRDGRTIEFNADNRLVVAPADGDNIALGLIDTTLFIFKRRQIYAMSVATAPDATGQGAFGEIGIIASDVGCTDPNSLVLTPNGLFFRSERGLQLMTTGGAVQYVGGPVERLLKGNTIIDATLVSAKNQCRFALSNGTILVLDHFLLRWSVYTNWAPLTSTMYQGAYTFANAAGLICTESTGFIDTLATGPTPDYFIKVQSPWIPLGAVIQSCGRIRRVSVLGDYKNAHTLNVSLAYDFNPTWLYTIKCVAGVVVPEQWVIRAPRQVAQSVSLLLQDVPSGTDSQSITISDITVEVMPKSGVPRTTRRL